MNAIISYALVLSLLSTLFPVSVGFAGQASYPSSPAAQGTPRPVDGGWPRAYITATGARLVLYEPQIERWADQKRMVMDAAVSYTPAGQHARAEGSVSVTTTDQLNRDFNSRSDGAQRARDYDKVTRSGSGSSRGSGSYRPSGGSFGGGGGARRGGGRR